MKPKSILLLFGVYFIILMGCRKRDGLPTTIIGTYTSQKGLTFTGTFTATAGLTTSGTTVMDVTVAGDSLFCTNKFLAPEGTFKMKMECSMLNNTGHWKITGGTGHYGGLRGEGSLIMTFPPDVPSGVLNIETMTGVVWLNP
jgi:hypothetical protein